jgi:hypothetical protein
MVPGWAHYSVKSCACAGFDKRVGKFPSWNPGGRNPQATLPDDGKSKARAQLRLECSQSANIYRFQIRNALRFWCALPATQDANLHLDLKLKPSIEGLLRSAFEAKAAHGQDCLPSKMNLLQFCRRCRRTSQWLTNRPSLTSRCRMARVACGIIFASAAAASTALAARRHARLPM